jgi:uncharacterized protein YjbJ (UPF0337 family)
MRASYWLLGLLLSLFCSPRWTPEQALDAFFFSRETQLVLFELFVLFVGGRNLLKNNILHIQKETFGKAKETFGKAKETFGKAKETFGKTKGNLW